LKPSISELDHEHQLLSNGEQLLSTAEMVYSLLAWEDSAPLTKLNQALKKMDDFCRLNPSIKEVAERFSTAYLELQDISSEIEGFKEDFEFDPQRLQFIEERLAEMHRLKNKHALDTADQLIEVGKEIEQRLLSMANFEGDIAKLEYELSSIQKELLESAETLSQKRKASFASLERSIANTLMRLGMPNAQFKVECIAGELSPTGIDKIDFLFSSNKGKDLQSIRKVASGGELSRIMLAIKRELASRKQMPALFFDEIDTGVSGEVADQLGNILREMGDKHQIISITHLPQLAAKGKSHYFVFKSSNELATLTNVKQLTEEERVAELAKMLSGEKISEAAFNNARELLAR
jgi:DNA repair protein RecN (Recombination protein N)